MSISLRLGGVLTQGTCEGCDTAGPLLTLIFYAGQGTTDLPPLCLSCLSKQERFVQLEEPDLSGGRRPPSKRDKRIAQRQERGLAEDTGGRRQPASGALPGAKGDVRKRGVYRGESKFTRNKSFPLTRQLLDKISGECGHGEYPVLDVNFVDANGRSQDRWVCLPYDTWKDKHASSNTQ